MKRNTRNPIGKALEALVWFIETDRDHVGVRELAGAMDISPSSAHRVLTELVEAGFMAQESGSQRYGLGVEFFRIAQLGSNKLPVRQAGIAAMRRLVKSCNEMALLGLYDPARQQMFFAASIEPTHPLRYVIELNKWVPVHTGATGLAIMASLPDAEINSIIERSGLAPLTDRSITNAEHLWDEIRSIRKKGYAITRGQRTEGAVGLAAPIFDGMGHVIGDICLTIPELRFEHVDEKGLVSQLLESAAEITERIGGRRPVAKQ